MTCPNECLEIYVHIIAMILVIIAAINWGLVAFLKKNLVYIISSYINNLFNAKLHLDKIIYALVTFAAIVLLFKRSTWLPFLENTALPTILFEQKYPKNFNKVVTINTKPNRIIVYWAAYNKNEPRLYVKEAYKNYENSGITMSDENGVAQLKIVEGEGYYVRGRYLQKHIHYRVSESSGMLGRVETINY